MLKGLIQSRNTREEKDLQNKPPKIKKTAIGTFINNYFKCKWIKCSNQKTQTGSMDTKTRPYICCLQETHFRPQDTQTESERMEKYILANGKKKKAGVVILISDKIDLKIKDYER